MGSAAGSLAGSVGATVGGWLTSVVDTINNAVDAVIGFVTGGSSGSSNAASANSGSDGSGATIPGTSGQVPVDSVTPREASPSEDWARANSEVRSSLPTTGVGVTDLLLWALTAAAAGATLILFAKRRQARDAKN